LLDHREKELRMILQDNIWSNSESENIEDAILKILTNKNMTIATVESETGGLLAKTLNDSEYSSNYYKGGMVISIDSIQQILKIDANLFRQYGKMSPEIVAVMATCIREMFKSDIGISIVRMIYPDSKDGKKADDLYIGIDCQGDKYTTTRKYPGQHYQVKRLGVMSALFKLRKILVNGGKNAFNN
jgi:nicotinamide-nucleotide amidase